MPTRNDALAVMQLIVDISHALSGTVHWQPADPVKPRMEAIDTYIVCNLDRQITLADLARHVGMNRTALCRFMRTHFDTTPMAHLAERRLLEAARLLC